MREDIVSIFIFGNNHSLLSNSVEKVNKEYNFSRQKWYGDALDGKGKSIMIKPHKQSYVMNSNKLVISLSRSINSYDSDEQVGVILIDLNLKVLEDICRNVKLGKNGYVFIVDSDGNVVYHPDDSYMYRTWDEMYLRDIFKTDDSLIPDVIESDEGSFVKKIDSEQKQITYKKFDAINWTIVGVTPYSEIMYEINKIRDFIVIIGIFCLLCAFIVSVLISSTITKPMTRLELLMREAEKGNLDVSLDVKSNDEIGKLSKRFNNMITKIKNLMTQIVREQEDKRKTELKALQAQINPHFLYNTLDSIIWMAEVNKDEVVVMADALANLFRLSLSRGEDLILIEHEIEHVKNYLIIQSMRYSNKFDYIIDVDEDILKHKALKLILQPLVENSIYHGVKNKRQKGLIIIRGRKSNGKILLQVMDDGIGMTQSRCEEIVLSRHSGRSGKRFNGVGVKNVNERIKLYHGNEYGLEYISQPGVGTVVQIWIPVL
jgi:two-component system sensor histidine kinase YesM